MTSNASQSNHVSSSSQEACSQDVLPSQFEVVKKYPPRGPLRLYRLASSTSFSCSRCHRHKTAKLIATQDNKWDTVLCNACYGLLLSKD